MQPDQHAAWLKAQVEAAERRASECVTGEGRCLENGRAAGLREVLRHYEGHPRYSVEEIRELFASEPVLAAVLEVVADPDEAGWADESNLYDDRPRKSLWFKTTNAALDTLTQQVDLKETDRTRQVKSEEGGDGVGAGTRYGRASRPEGASVDSVATSTQGGDAVDLRGPSGCAGKRHVTGGGAGNGPASETCECGHGRDQHYSLLSTTSCSRCPCEAFTSVQHHSRPQVGEGNA